MALDQLAGASGGCSLDLPNGYPFPLLSVEQYEAYRVYIWQCLRQELHA